MRSQQDEISNPRRGFLGRHRAQLGLPKVVLGAAATTMLATGDWPGNVRELEHAIARAICALVFARLPVNRSSSNQPSPISTAIRYALNQWRELGRFLDDARAPLDNNVRTLTSPRRAGAQELPLRR